MSNCQTGFKQSSHSQKYQKYQKDQKYQKYQKISEGSEVLMNPKSSTESIHP